MIFCAEVVELVDTLLWGGSGATCGGSNPPLGTNFFIVSLCTDWYEIALKWEQSYDDAFLLAQSIKFALG